MPSSLTHIAWITADKQVVQDKIDHLEQHGFSVHHEASEQEWEITQQQWEREESEKHTDLVIFSHQGAKDGVNDCISAKNSHPAKILPSILIVKDISKEDKELYFQTSGHGLIIEPYGPDEILNKVRHFIEYHKYIDELSDQKAELSKQVEEASQMALLAMENSSDLGSIVNFVKNSIKSKSHEELSKQIFEATALYSDNCLVELKGHNQRHYFSSNHHIDPDLKRFMLSFKGKDRLVKVDDIIQINHEYLVLLVEGLPLDDSDKMGRISDTLVMLCDAANRFAKSLAIEENLKTTDQSRRYFLTTLSHELRTPLNGILGFSKALAGKKEDQTFGASGIDALNRIVENSSKINAIVTTLIDISHSSNSVQNVEDKEINVANLFLLLKNEFTHQAEDKNIAVNISVPPELVIINDQHKIMSMLRHLVNNAIKFTDKGQILICASKEVDAETGDRVLFKIRDTGIGIDAADHQRIFSEIGQLNCEHNRQHYGIGLGLYYVNLISQQMNGKVYVESELGRGSTFYLDLLKGHLKPQDEAIQEDTSIDDLLF